MTLDQIEAARVTETDLSIERPTILDLAILRHPASKKSRNHMKPDIFNGQPYLVRDVSVIPCSIMSNLDGSK